MSSPARSRVIRSEIVLVAHGDEIGAGRVERIGEHARFAGQRPAIGRDTRGCSRSAILLQRAGSPRASVGVRFDDLGALRLELAQPVERAVEAIQIRSKGCIAASTTMPKLVLPEPSGINQTQ